MPTTANTDTPLARSRPTAQQRLDVTRRAVKEMLLASKAFGSLPLAQQREIAKNTVDVVHYLAAPEGIPGNELPQPQTAETGDAYAFPMADNRSQSASPGDAPPTFTAQGAREGAAVAGELLRQVNFPEFVSGLINGVFHSIVDASIKQMEAYGRLVADVAKSLNQFRDENVSINQGRDHLVEQFPDTFEIQVDTGDSFFGEEEAGPRVRLREGVDERQALDLVNSSLPMEEGPLRSLDLEDQQTETRLVQAARTQLATSRQQLLATMVMMGINRIIVTDGRISAKVLYDFRAQDNFRYRRSATQFDYDPELKRRTGTSQYARRATGQSGKRDASYYSRGTYKTTEEPLMTLASATQEEGSAALATKASLAGSVDVNFRSETFPLEKLADSFQIEQIQGAARPRSQIRPQQPSADAATPAAETPNA